MTLQKKKVHLIKQSYLSFLKLTDRGSSRPNNKTMVVQKKDRKAARKSALATLKSRRSGGGNLSALNDNDDDMHPSATNNSNSALDSYHATMEDVYDTYADEEEYRQLVEKEREREDFVVDDGEFLQHKVHIFKMREYMSYAESTCLCCVM